MSILEFGFADHRNGWSLEPVRFGALELLVGHSGVGKSRVLQAIHDVCRLGQGIPVYLPRCAWRIEVQIGDDRAAWSAETGEQEGRFGLFHDPALAQEPGREAAPFLREEIRWNGEVIAARDGEGVSLRGQRWPGLRQDASVVSIFSDQIFKSVHENLSKVTFSESIKTDWSFKQSSLEFKKTLKSLNKTTNDDRSLIAYLYSKISILLRAALLQQIIPETFSNIIHHFTTIFPFVSEVFIGPLDEIYPGADPDTFDIAFREHGSPWIRSRDMSTGMRRTLIHLIEVALAPPGTVFLVDEYENSLGVNCLSALTDQLQRRAGEVQFILTSHHPYVIENIPKQYWKILTRRGGAVRARGYEHFPSLQTRSRQGNFSQLLDLLDREDVQAAHPDPAPDSPAPEARR